MRILEISLSFLLCVPAMACDDSKQVYKSCGDQSQILQSARAEAARTHRTLVLSFGSEDCPRCQAVATAFETSARLKDRYLLVDLALRNRHETVPSGYQELRDASAKAGTVPKAAMPVVFVADPQTGTTVHIPVGELEIKKVAPRKSAVDPHALLGDLNAAYARLLRREIKEGESTKALLVFADGAAIVSDQGPSLILKDPGILEVVESLPVHRFRSAMDDPGSYKCKPAPCTRAQLLMKRFEERLLKEFGKAETTTR